MGDPDVEIAGTMTGRRIRDRCGRRPASGGALEGVADEAGDQPLQRHAQVGDEAAEVVEQLVRERDSDVGDRFHGHFSSDRDRIITTARRDHFLR